MMTAFFLSLFLQASVAPATKIPEPPQLTIQDFKAKIADLTMQSDKQAEYIQILRAKIAELQEELEKAKPKPPPQ